MAFDAELWPWDARRTQSWIFVSLPAGQFEEIRDLARRVAVRLRFGPGARHDRDQHVDDLYLPRQACYVLPVKGPARVDESLDVGDVAAC